MIFLYSIISILLYIISRPLSGLDNGAYYSKNKYGKDGIDIHGNPHPNKKVYLRIFSKIHHNYHHIETSQWYTSAGVLFFALLALFSVMDEKVWLSWVVAMMITLGASAVGGPFYQGIINVSVGDPFFNRNEGTKTEFAFWFIVFKYPRLFSGYWRIFSAVLGLLAIVIGIILINKF